MELKGKFDKALLIVLLLQCASCSVNTPEGGQVLSFKIGEPVTKEFKGGAWLKDNEIVRGMDISVCIPTAIKEMQIVLDRHRLLWQKEQPVGEMFSFIFPVVRVKAGEDLQKTVKSLHESSQCIVKSSTDIEGKYSFIISNQEMSSHSKLFAFSLQQNVFWVVDLANVTPKNRIDLDNQNQRLVLNPYDL